VRKRKTNREFWNEHREQFEQTERLLKERIAYHRAKVVEARPGWTPPATEEEWSAYNEARIRAEIAERQNRD
jgi:hypothetical protein